MFSVNDKSSVTSAKKVECKFCCREAKYTCPRCNCNYCSVKCYKCNEHVQCSEEFYKAWVMTEMKNRKECADTKLEMLKTLKRLHEEEREEDDDDDLENKINFIQNSDNLKEEDLWKFLTKDEKDRFQEIVNSDEVETILPVWNPWWNIRKPRVQELCSSEDRQLDIQPLSRLTSRLPSECIKYNLVNVVYSYVYVAKKYNGDYCDFPAETVGAILYLSPVLYTNANFNNVSEAVQYCIQKLCIGNGDFFLVREAAVELLKDVSSIFESIDPCVPEKSVINSLSDVIKLFREVKKCSGHFKNKSKVLIEKEKLKKSIKKLEYFISWSVEYNTCFQQLISELEIEYISSVENTLPCVKIERKKTAIIEELT
ncbi:zinc finger HIT domain-containing protein 2-like [Centruroides sculpturatus]|uniref:zinc finger HIT domain-containing protein 2-like n=1 Tax=Centruroides sculpturatus TaxID=218467 RepID=UPI000C6C8EFD|nr:zinc finger HIT domain-containing protein 2-like [Centruroides sculpturatus]XP_023242362.1 zinc finger HIT domain-containing protein 2-like [Centruroides sculpturatus]